MTDTEPTQRNERCGCIFYDHADGRTETTPCIPHGFAHVAKGLGMASEALGNMATRMIQEAEAASKPKGPQIII